eukprot:PhF_6_TR33805/c0_g1_i1/m.49576
MALLMQARALATLPTAISSSVTSAVLTAPAHFNPIALATTQKELGELISVTNAMRAIGAVPVSPVDRVVTTLNSAAQSTKDIFLAGVRWIVQGFVSLPVFGKIATVAIVCATVGSAVYYFCVPKATTATLPQIASTTTPPTPPTMAMAAPEEFVCPITQLTMVDPVMTSDGFTYERHVIETWLTRDNRSPMTGLPLTSTNVTPNINLRHAIERWVAAH